MKKIYLEIDNKEQHKVFFLDNIESIEFSKKRINEHEIKFIGQGMQATLYMNKHIQEDNAYALYKSMIKSFSEGKSFTLKSKVFNLHTYYNLK